MNLITGRGFEHLELKTDKLSVAWAVQGLGEGQSIMSMLCLSEDTGYVKEGARGFRDRFHSATG